MLARCWLITFVFLINSGCASLLPDSATQENRNLLYSQFYEAGFSDTGAGTDELARKLELCGRQLYVKDKGLFGAMRTQEKHGEEVSFGDVVALFTEDACLPPKYAPTQGENTNGSG